MRNWLLIVAALSVLPEAALAQAESTAKTRLTEKLSTIRKLGDAPTHAQIIYEDIEVMRLLLAQKLARVSSQLTEASVNATWLGLATPKATVPTDPAAEWKRYASHDDVNTTNALAQLATAGQSTPLKSVEGVYLDGKGIVFTITLANSKANPLPTDQVATVAALSDWERTRQQVRGDKAEPTAKSAVGSPSTSDIILKVLADNGKHVHLRDGEDITVVVTFRAEVLALQALGYRTNELALEHYSAGGANRYSPITIAPSTPDQAATGPPAAPTSQGKSARDFELLGDLHLRQKEYGSSLEAYSTALKLFPDPNIVPELYRKMADLQLQLGDMKQARIYLEQAIVLRDGLKSDPTKSVAPKANPARQSLPAKLILTAPKKLLDDVAGGKLSLDEFKKSVKVEYFPLGEKQ